MKQGFHETFTHKCSPKTCVRQNNNDVTMKVFTWRIYRTSRYFTPSSCHPSDHSDVLEAHVGAQAASDDHAEQHHDLLPPGLLLVLQRLLGVVGGPGGVLHRALHVSVDPVDHLALVLDQDGDVHEHLVQLLDGGLQLDEHLVPVLDVLQRLPQLGRVALDLDVARQPRPAAALQTKQYRYPFCTSVEVTRNI